MDSSEDYQIRFYLPGEEQQIVDLLSLVFTEWRARGEKALDHWRWMYQDNPLGPCNVAVAVKDDEIVGVGHDLHFYTKVGDTIEKTLYGTDVTVHPKHRRRGIYSKLLEVRLAQSKGYGFRYSYSTNKILIERSNRKRREGDDPNFLFPVDINRYLLIRDVDLHLEKKQTDNPWLKKQGYFIKKLISTMKTPLRLNDGPRNIEVSETRYFNDADILWDKVKSRYKFIAMKNKAYLEWRFSDPRSGDYHILSAHRDHEIYGYIVVSIDYETPDYPMGNIIDFLTIEEGYVEKMLLQEVLSWLEDHQINAVSAYVVKGSRISRVLESFGFVDRGDSLYAVYRIPSRRGETHPDIEQSDVNQFHLMYSDFYVK